MEQVHLKQFSPDQKLFALIDQDGKLKIWDTESNQLKQEYVPNLHLSTPCTTLVWIEVNTNLKSGKKKKPRVSEGGSSLYIVLGTNKGGLAMYSYSTAKLEKSFQGEGHSSAVTCVVFNGEDSLFSSGLDGKVIEWSVSKCHQKSYMQCGSEKITAIGLLPGSERIVTASKVIKIWNLSTKQQISSFTGHSSNIITLKTFTHDSEYYILSGSKTDRNLSMWYFNEQEKSIKNTKNAVTTLSLQNAPNFVDFSIVEDTLRVAVITMNESLQYFEVNLNSLSAKKPIKSKFTIEIASESGKQVEVLPIKAAYLVNDEILFGYGGFLMNFELTSIQQSQKSTVLIRKDPMKLKEKKKESDDQVLNVVTPITENNVEYLNAVSSTSLKKPVKTVEIPMETRLENLKVGDGAKPNAKNMAQLLVQGLHNKDVNILKLVLRQKDEETVRLTVKRLPAQYIVSLVNELSTMMSRKFAASDAALLWLRHLMQIHASQLMGFGVENLQANFGACLGIIDHRSQNLSNLSRLRGRLDLLANQLKQSNDIEDDINNENLLVYQEENDLDSIADESSSSEEDANHFDEFEDSDNEDNEPLTNGKSDESMENGNLEDDEDENDEEMEMSD